jgi:tetratricopeptide (TPR) repeat protein
LLQQALASAEKNFEPGHPTIATYQSSLASVEESLGNLQEAELLFRNALQSRLKTLPKGHKGIKDSFTFLIKILEKTGQNIEAKKLQIEAMEHETGDATQTELRQMATKYYELEQYDKA